MNRNSPIRILFLGQSEAARRLVPQALEKERDQVQLQTAADSTELRAAIARDPFDILLLDLDLHQPASEELLKWLKSRHELLPVILLADVESEDLATKTIQFGVADYVVKDPARIQRLTYSIRLVLEKTRLRAERQVAEDELRHLTASLESRVAERTAQLASANQELEAFSYSVSHDLRAPIRAIEGFARILVEDYSEQLDPDAKRFLQIIVSSTEQMNRLIEDLLTFSRLTRADLVKQHFDMLELVQAVIPELRRSFPDHPATLKLPSQMPASGDPSLLRQVWFNLLANAFKFTRHTAHPCIEIGTYRQNGELVYFVKDNGVGFDMRYSHKLFNVFQRLHRSDQFEGTGVGLAIVKRIVQRHGGRVWAEGKINAGATFYFSLPHENQRS